MIKNDHNISSANKSFIDYDSFNVICMTFFADGEISQYFIPYNARVFDFLENFYNT